MGNSKVIFGGETVIDLTSDTVAADKMMSGITAHNKAGDKITGTFTLDSEMSAQDTLIANIKTALEGKAAGGGGGNVDTCTICINSDIPSGYLVGGYVTVTQYIDGNFVASLYGWFSNSPSTIENVVCGSVISLRTITPDGCGTPKLSDNMIFLSYNDTPVAEPNIFAAIAAPTESNAIGEIRLMP